jgi:hypothetical protein
MGYQESFVWCDDFDWLINKVNELGENWFEERFVDVVEVVTLRDGLKFNLEQMCKPKINKEFQAGTKFLWIVGDRSYQRCIIGENGLLGKNIPKDKKIELYFIECISDKLFTDDKKWNFDSESFKYNNELKVASYFRVGNENQVDI